MVKIIFTKFFNLFSKERQNRIFKFIGEIRVEFSQKENYSKKINLERLIKTLQPKQLITDGSNYKSDVLRWKVIAEKQKTPFYNTSKNGAYILKLKE